MYYCAKDSVYADAHTCGSQRGGHGLLFSCVYSVHIMEWLTYRRKELLHLVSSPSLYELKEISLIPEKILLCNPVDGQC